MKILGKPSLFKQRIVRLSPFPSLVVRECEGEWGSGDILGNIWVFLGVGGGRGGKRKAFQEFNFDINGPNPSGCGSPSPNPQAVSGFSCPLECPTPSPLPLPSSFAATGHELCLYHYASLFVCNHNSLLAPFSLQVLRLFITHIWH